MPDKGPASEFGGKVTGRLGIQPAPHVPTPSERLSALYRSGDESGLSPPDSGEAFSGLIETERQTELREQEGALRHGEEWERIEAEGQAAIESLRTPDV